MFNKCLTITFIIICIIILTNITSSEAYQDQNINEKGQLKKIADLDAIETGRRRRPFGFFKHALGHGFGIHALAILYWLKVKAIIIAFIVGTAIVWGSKYYFAHTQKCQNKESNIIEGPIMFDHGHPWSSSGHHDHISYSSPYSVSSDSNYLSSDNGPYSAYGSPFTGSSPTSYSGPYSGSPPDGTDIPYVDNHHDKKWKRDTAKQNGIGSEDKMEEGISELAFIFLGVGSESCRRRFVCEWEFHASRHPLTRMIFRVVGKGLFKKYARNPNDENEAKSFHDCARANSECVFIEEHIQNTDIEENNQNIEENNQNIEEKIDEKIENKTKTNLQSDPIAKVILRRKL